MPQVFQSGFQRWAYQASGLRRSRSLDFVKRLRLFQDWLIAFTGTACLIYQRRGLLQHAIGRPKAPPIIVIFIWVFSGKTAAQNLPQKNLKNLLQILEFVNGFTLKTIVWKTLFIF